MHRVTKPINYLNTTYYSGFMVKSFSTKQNDEPLKWHTDQW